MALAGLIVELVFGGIGLTPHERNAKVVEAHVALNYTTALNVVFLALASALVWRFVGTGGLPMLRRMNMPPDARGHGHVH